jgi:hypothetical protein
MTWGDALNFALLKIAVRREAFEPGKWVIGDEGRGAVVAVVMVRLPSGEIRVATEEDIGADGYGADDWVFVTSGGGEKQLVGFTWRALGIFDDDASLFAVVDGTEKALSDTVWNLSWYNGETFVPEPRSGYLTTNRVIAVSAVDAAALGVALSSGMTVRVYGVDGWAANWQISPWQVTFYFSDGSTVEANGGWTEIGTGTSTATRPPGMTDADYFLHSGPYATVGYRFAGEFQLP